MLMLLLMLETNLELVVSCGLRVRRQSRLSCSTRRFERANGSGSKANTTANPDKPPKLKLDFPSFLVWAALAQRKPKLRAKLRNVANANEVSHAQRDATTMAVVSCPICIFFQLS